MSSPLFGRKKMQFSHNINDYKVEASLGGGGFGNVQLANFNGQEVVLKRISKPKSDPQTCGEGTKRNEEDFIHRELEAGRRLHHKGIAQLYDHFEDNDNHYFVVEYVKGGDLFSVMDERSFEPLRESDAKKLFRQIVRAVQYSHSQGVYHLDLKLENILITLSSNRMRTKIIDFGLCHLASEGSNNKSVERECTSPKCSGDMCRKWAGSPDYCCPEILVRKAYSAEKGDVWSLGVILYILLFAELPFSRKDRYKGLRQGKHPNIAWANSNSGDNCDFDTDASAGIACEPSKLQYQGVSEAAKDLITQMLDPEHSTRATIEQILKHRWLRTKFETLSEKLFSSSKSSSSSSSSSACASSLPGSPAIASAPPGRQAVPVQ